MDVDDREGLVGVSAFDTAYNEVLVGSVGEALPSLLELVKSSGLQLRGLAHVVGQRLEKLLVLLLRIARGLQHVPDLLLDRGLLCMYPDL